MTRVVERTVYAFSELSEKAKDRARDRVRDWDVTGSDWWDSIYDDAVRLGAVLGIEIAHKHKHGSAIWFTGFCSQGDGASFEGLYTCKPGATAEIMQETGGSEPLLIQIASELTALQIRAKMEFGATVSTYIHRQSSMYCHSNTMETCDTTIDTMLDLDFNGPLSEDYDRELQNLMRRFADWIYRSLEKEHDYLTSNEHIDEMLSDEDYEFNEDGSKA